MSVADIVRIMASIFVSVASLQKEEQVMKPNRRFPSIISCMLVSCIGASVLTLLPAPAFAQDNPSPHPGQTALAVAVGWEHLAIGDVEFGGKYDYNQSLSPLVEINEQQDGNFNGVRTDVALSTPAQLFGWSHGLASLKGHHSWHDDSTTFNCVSGSVSASCDGTSLFEPGTADNNSLGIGTGETVTYFTDRTVRHWGVALETSPANMHTGDLQHRLGVGYRAIDQDMDLVSAWSLSASNQLYDEMLDTGYLGAYWGIDGRRALADGLQLVYSGEAGVYWARTDYQGALTQTDLAGTLSQSLSLDRNDTAFIGALNLAVEKQFEGFTLSGFVRGEYYSYAPQMAYNQTDRTVAFPSGFSLSGPNVETSIDDRDAWSLTVGGALRIPVGSVR
jgi:hypothetical protein